MIHKTIVASAPEAMPRKFSLEVTARNRTEKARLVCALHHHCPQNFWPGIPALVNGESGITAPWHGSTLPFRNPSRMFVLKLAFGTDDDHI
jgi:hypothetical protein